MREQDEKQRMQRLVRLAKNKDAGAFSLLYEMVYADLYKMALYTLGNPQDAEDMVSETVLDAYVSLDKLRDETAFRGWIFRILGYKCKHKIREYIREREYVRPESDEDRNHASPVDEMENLLDKQEIARAFSAISREERLIVAMVAYGGYTSREIAEVLDCNRNTVRSKYRRALEKMQKILG